MHPLRLIILVPLVALVGCATQSISFKDGNSVAVQADKRVVISSVDSKGSTLICAEPSPDAIAGLAAQLAAKVDVPGGPSGEASAGFARTMASIGVRTAGLQILRDLAYRACEGVINGVVTRKDYDTLIYGSGAVAVALIAVEGLTQMQPAPLVSVGPGGAASTGKDTTSAEAKAATTTIQVVGKDYKPEELKHVADNVYNIVKLIVDRAREASALKAEGK
jgi:hypothetical protein